jgi:ethanolamine permease
MSVVGIVCVIFGNVAAIVCISSMGSAVMSILCVLAVFKLRKFAPDLERPYKVAYPIFPIIALITDVVVIIGVVVSICNQGKLIFAVIGAYALAIIYYFTCCRNKKSHFDEE